MFFGNSRIIGFFLISLLNCEQHGNNQYKKKKHNQDSLVFKLLK